jgi:hypothetical protein
MYILVLAVAGSGFFGAISNVLRSAGGTTGSMPQETVKALQTELSTWETLAQVSSNVQQYHL